MFSKFKHYIFSNKKDRKKIVLFSFVSLFVLFAIVSTFTFYIYFNQVFKKFHIENMEKDQTTMNSNVDSLQILMPKLAIQLLNNSDITTVMLSDNVNVAITKRAIDFISSVKFNNDVSTIVIYDPKTQCIWPDNTMSKISLDEYEKINPDFDDILNHFKNQKMSWYYSAESEFSQGQYTYTYQDYRGYIMLFNLSPEYFKKHILQNTMHENYNIWIYYNNMPFMKTNEEIPDKLTADELSRKAPSFIYNSNLYVQNELRNMKYVTSISYIDILIDGLKNSLFIWFFISIIFILTIFAVKYFLRFYQQTVNKYLSNIKSAHDDMNALRFNWLMTNLFDGALPPAKDIPVIKAELGSGYYRIFVIQLDDKNLSSRENTCADASLLNYGIRNATTEIFSQFGRCFSFEIESDTSVFVLTSVDEVSFDKFKQAISRIKSLATELYSVTLTVTVSHTLKNFDEFMNIAPIAMEFSNYRYINGYDSIFLINPALISNTDCDEKLLSHIYSGITSAIDEKDFYSVSRYLSAFTEEVKNINPIFIQNHLQHMFLYVMQNAKDCGLTAKEYNHLRNQQTLAEAIQYFKEILTKNNNVDFEINKDFLEVAESIMAKNYNNPTFNINFIAEKLQISNTYAGKKFKQMFGCSFNNYLMEYRLNIASDMLKNTGKKISEIASKCGFSSDTYFVTSFKKMMHMTPTEYRNQL